MKLGFARRPLRCNKYLFDDLPPEVRWRAEGWLEGFCRRWKGNLPSWRRALLVGRARWLALNPPTSHWGRSMLAKRGGYGAQQRFREQGRTGENHPAHKAARVSARNRRLLAQIVESEKRRETLGIPPEKETRHKFLIV
jgi:hypothetical protein